MRRGVAADPCPPEQPAAERFPAAVGFADISGFTALAEKLAQQSRSGVEQLRDVLDRCFGRLVELVTAHGGEVLKFAGDAVLALWPAGPDGGLAAAARRAAECALAAQRSLDGLEADPGIRLRLRLGVGVGEVWSARVGGVEGRWESLVAGEPLQEAAAAERRAQPGETVLSAGAAALLGGLATGQPLPEGFLLLRGIHGEPLPHRPMPVPALPAVAEAALRAYVPRAVQARIDAGQTDWLGEFRNATALFCDVRGLDPAAPGALDRVQEATRCLQAAVYRFGGSVVQYLVDDKGTVLVAGWGLALHTHEDDASRAVLAALALQAGLRDLGLEATLGIATGRVFTGTRGGPSRLEHAMIGNTVNLAARLMQAAGGILCDQATRAAARRRVLFETLAPIRVKGRASPVAVFRPVGERRRSSGRPELLGRHSEKEALAACLRRLEDHGEGGVVVIEGEPGLGKSRLILDFLEHAQGSPVRSLTGSGDALERSTHYFAWRSLFGRILGFAGPGEPRERLQLLLETAPPELRTRSALIGALFSIDMPGERFPLMTAENRAEMTRDLLVHILRKSVERTAPMVLVLEDAHWLDSASWALADAVRRQVPRVLLVLATRPLSDEERSPECRRLLEDPATLRLRLETLSPEDSLALVGQRLDADSIPQPLADFIHKRTEGHPFYIEELAYNLRDRGLIHVEDGICRLAAGGDLVELETPNHIQGVIHGRIDRLTPQQQLTLKVASVTGRTFESETLCELHPLGTGPDELLGQLRAMVQHEILRPVSGEGLVSSFTFKHALIQEVAYNLLPFAQRRQLHRALAERLERTRVDDPLFYPLLADHWSKAEERAKSLEYLEKAGEETLRSGAYREASSFFQQLSSLAEGVEIRQQARWERKLGIAYEGLGRYPESRQHYERSVELLGKPVPATGWRLSRELLGQVLVQGMHRLRPPAAAGHRSGPDCHLSCEIAEALQGLGSIYYIGRDSPRTFYSIVRSLNLAEQAGCSSLLPWTYAAAHYMAGLARFRRLNEIYYKKALETGHSCGDLQTLAFVLYTLGIYHLGAAEWDKARDEISRSEVLYHQLGEQRRYRQARIVWGFGALQTGDLELASQIYEEGERACDDRLHQSWGLLGLGRIALWQGHPDRAVQRLETALQLIRENSDHGHEILCLGTLALAHGDQEDRQAAFEGAEMAARRILAAPPFPSEFHSVAGYVYAAEACLALWETGAAAALGLAPGELSSRAQRLCGALRRSALVFPVGRPGSWRCQGLLRWLQGSPSRAFKAWRKGLAAAEALGMSWDEGLAHLEIGRHLPEADPARHHHLERAQEIFAQIGAVRGLARVRQAREA